jgi:hypothetical protein
MMIVSSTAPLGGDPAELMISPALLTSLIIPPL